MDDQTRTSNISRRKFLYGSALAAGSAMLAACSSKKNNSGGSNNNGGGGNNPSSPSGGGGSKGKGSAAKPLPTPSSFSESPTLAAQAKAGKLPAVEKRLPTKPLVLPHNWVSEGTYGGVLNMDQFGTHGVSQANAIREFYYGFSPTRWLNDGLDIGPGTADSWTSNADATVWTVHFRDGLKWSDGVEFSVDDIIFWYEDMALPGHNAQTPPPDLLSAKGNPAKMSKTDNNTLVITYDSPQPLLPDYLAAWVKGNIGGNFGNGPVWMYPKHYMKQFHPKYNKAVKSGWDAPGGPWELHGDWLRNPACPTLTGFRCKTFNNNTGVTLEPNPYYYVVSKEGKQLPYLDAIKINLIQQPQTIKLDVQGGKLDFCMGSFNQIDLSDVSTLSQTTSKGKYKIVLWDSGSGTGQMFFFNRDYQDPKYQKIFRDKRLIRALSFAYNRADANKTLYYKTGEITTGTMSPKAVEFHTDPDGQANYKAWRDVAKEYNPSKAKALLAEMGLKDTNGDGYVEFPDGSKLSIEIPYAADASNTSNANDDQIVANAKAIGLHMTRRPIPPQAYPDAWNNGTLMSHTNWEVGDGPNCLVYPQWMAPLEYSRWAPLEGAWYQVTGTPKQHQELNVNPWKRHPPRMPPEKGGPTAKLIDLYNQTKLEPDQLKRTQLVWQMMKIHTNDGPFFFGSTANYPQVITHHVDLRNVPDKKNLGQGGFVNPWVVPCPAVYDPECWYWPNPTQHNT